MPIYNSLKFPCFFVLYRMSLLEMSAVTVLVGITSHGASFVTDVQMTRRISKVVLHSQYNAITYVSCHIKTESILDSFDSLIIIWIRPMTLPSLHWTCQWFYPGLLVLFVCRRPVQKSTNTPTNRLLLWDGQQTVTINHQLIINFWLWCGMDIFCSIRHTISYGYTETGNSCDFVQLRLQGRCEFWQICDGRQYLYYIWGWKILMLCKFPSQQSSPFSSVLKVKCLSQLQGDIGGPVLVLSSPGIWTQIGINSFVKSNLFNMTFNFCEHHLNKSNHCVLTGDCDSNSLQTRVSAFKAWIDLYRN